ncbi:acyl-CoA N-acyltransferase [Lentinula detonsa]|uniref:Acyl-CoA N-acyltransferase n=1 Tax=Lentinula detonsa TaxID=2804962 RepID=A0A9W8TYW5_9AGAR|nr:acyl-CoA N-acyltransferase [Lentinula detonsa]
MPSPSPSHPSPSQPTSSSQPQSQPQPSQSPSPQPSSSPDPIPITYRLYTGEPDLPHIISLIASELSEPYVIYTFRYFLTQWPHLSFLAYTPESPTPIGVIVCKQSFHKSSTRFNSNTKSNSEFKSKSNARGHGNRGYIAMLSVDKRYRKRGIASTLVKISMEAMKLDGVEEISLETEHDNAPALSLYESLGFIREKRLYRFYLNGKDAFRLVLGVPVSELEDEKGDGDGDTLSVSSPSSSLGSLSGSGRRGQGEMKMNAGTRMNTGTPGMRRYTRPRPGALGPRRYRAIVVDGDGDDEEGEDEDDEENTDTKEDGIEDGIEDGGC